MLDLNHKNDAFLGFIRNF